MLFRLECRWHFDKQEEPCRSTQPWMSGIPHQLSSLKVHTIEQWGESNPKHLSYVSYTHRLFVQVLGKTLAKRGEGVRERERGGYINSCTSSPKGLSRGLCCLSSRCSAGKQNGEDCPTNAKYPLSWHTVASMCLNEYLKKKTAAQCVAHDRF